MTDPKFNRMPINLARRRMMMMGGTAVGAAVLLPKLSLAAAGGASNPQTGGVNMRAVTFILGRQS